MDIAYTAARIDINGKTVMDVNTDRMFSGASMIKLYLALLVAERVDSRKVFWSTPVAITRRHLDEEDGIIKTWWFPATLSLHDCVSTMLTISDNVAANAVIDFLGGPAAVNRELEDAGYRSRLRGFAGGAVTDGTVGDMVDSALPTRSSMSFVVPGEFHEWMGAAWKHLVLSPMLAACQDRTKLARGLDWEKEKIFHKTGTAYGVRHDGGVWVTGAGDVIATTVFTDGPDRPDMTDDPVCAEMGRVLPLVDRAGGSIADMWPDMLRLDW